MVVVFSFLLEAPTKTERRESGGKKKRTERKRRRRRHRRKERRKERLRCSRHPSRRREFGCSGEGSGRVITSTATISSDLFCDTDRLIETYILLRGFLIKPSD